MTEYIISHDRAKKACMDVIESLDVTKKHVVVITKAKVNRSAAQNRLSFKWYKHVSEQTGESPEEVRHYCKLTFGVPILELASDSFHSYWHKASLHMSYEEKLSAMEFLPVTSLFTVAQFTEYLETMDHRYAREGYPLPHPEDDFYSAMGLV